MHYSRWREPPALTHAHNSLPPAYPSHLTWRCLCFVRNYLKIMSSEPLLPATEQQLDYSAKCSFDFCTEGGSLPTLQSELKPEIVLVDERHKRQTWIVRWGRRRVLDPFIVILRRGLEPKLLALSAALGLTVGVFPVCGVTIGLCALIAVILRSKCHWPTLVLANFVVTPFELGLVVPFMRVGELVTNGRHFPFTPGAVWDVIRGRASRDVLFGVLHAVIGWSIFAPVCLSLLFVIFYPIFRFITLSPKKCMPLGFMYYICNRATTRSRGESLHVHSNYFSIVLR
ncbi:hypothetical protein GOP47_0011283 [Adiantum capillus-veneris]|uniref:DUF2062 domain-containing protein n=1 Tax=Adiantum capillus-veneris TaxID=13818 RepID=A0A9D4ZHH2_ADICA|nr:hypothetical protein GOP47_0011283 [Adiantum capillus-veneris]